jgi:hypothetical protein
MFEVEVLIDHTKVPAPQTDFPVYLDLSLLSSSHHYWFNGRADGGDIRVYNSAGQRMNVDVVEVDKANKKGEIHFTADSLSDTVDTLFRVEYGDLSLSQPAPNQAYGRNAVWSAYKAVWHLNDDPLSAEPQYVDATGNGYDLALGGGGGVNSSAQGKLGQALNSTGAYDFNDGLNYNSTSTTEITITQWLKINNASQTGAQVSGFGPGFPAVYSSYGRSLQYDNGNVYAMGKYGGSGGRISAPLTDTSAFHHICAFFASTGYLSIDNSILASGNIGEHYPYRFNINSARTGTNDVLVGVSDEVRIYEGELSASYRTTEFNNQDNPATFYTLGAVETEVISGAVALTDKSSSIGAGGGLLITGQAAAAQIVDAGESVLINGSLLNEASASITITDEGASFSAVGGTYISGDFVVTDSDSTVSLDTSMIMGMNAALQVNPESVQLFSDVIISATIALADNPTALFIEELAISPKLRIIVTGARIGNTIGITS